MSLQTISLEGGKYELRFNEQTGALCAYRYGEFWRDFSGDKFVYLLMQAALSTHTAQAEAPQQCEDNDSPWLICKSCAAAGKCAQAVRQEPVAWCALKPNGQIEYFDGRPMVMPGPVGNDVHPVPLYTAPQPPQPVALTEEQIDALTPKLSIADTWQSNEWKAGYGAATHDVRKLLRAYGITPPDQPADQQEGRPNVRGEAPAAHPSTE